MADMFRLTPDERAWLNVYRRALEREHYGMVTRMFIYGSKARGDVHPESDVDMLVIIRNDAHHLKRELRRLGYLLAATSEIVPSILAYIEDEWGSRRKNGSSFREAMERDAVLAL